MERTNATHTSNHLSCLLKSSACTCGVCWGQLGFGGTPSWRSVAFWSGTLFDRHHQAGTNHLIRRTQARVGVPFWFWGRLLTRRGSSATAGNVHVGVSDVLQHWFDGRAAGWILDSQGDGHRAGSKVANESASPVPSDIVDFSNFFHNPTYEQQLDHSTIKIVIWIVQFYTSILAHSQPLTVCFFLIWEKYQK